MRTLNLALSLLVMFVLSVFTGCSDQLTSPSADGSSTQNPSVNSATKEPSTIDLFRTQIRLKPYRSYKFNSSNTPFVRFNSVDVFIIDDPNLDKYAKDCQDLLVYSGVANDKKGSFGCHIKGLNESEIVVENTSSGFVDLNIVLSGVRSKVYTGNDSL